MGYPPVINIDRGDSPFKQVTAGLSGGLEKLVGDYREKNMRKQQLAGLAPLFEEMGIEAEDVEKLVGSGLDPQLAVQALGHMEKFKKQKATESDQLSDQDYTKILDDLESEFKGGGAGREAYLKSYLPGGGEKRRSTARVQALGTSLLGLAQRVALKSGIKNQREFDLFIKRTVPEESDAIDTALGKIDALRSYLKKGGTTFAAGAEKGGEEEFVMMQTPAGPRKVPKSKALEAQKHGAKIIQ